MSLPVLAVLVVVGIALIVMAIHLSGGSRPAIIDGEDHARALFAADHPASRAMRVSLTTDRGAAILQLEDGRIGLVRTIGAKYLTRILVPRDLAEVHRAGDRQIELRLTDFTYGGGRFDFADPATTEAVMRILDARGTRLGSAA